MGIRSLVSPIFIAFLLFVLIKAKRYTPGFIDGRPLKDHYAIQAVGADSAMDCYTHPENYGVNTFYFQQPLDQFDSSNKATWQQQVQWKNTSFKPKDDGDVVFLLLGGEGPIPTTWMCFMNYTWTQLAEQHGAFMFQLEHRYFGNSTPTSNMSVPNLEWLTTEQAMADINAFIPAMNKQFKFNKPKWVAFGGSYPGTVAALLRVVYPNITNGNIASSAPLWAKIDFWEYAEKMEEAIAWESQVNVSNAACYNDTKAAFAYIRQAVYTEAGRNELNTIFNITPFLGTNMNNIDFEATYFLANIYFTFEGIIQYTFDDRSGSTINRTAGLNVANLCAKMVDTNFNYTERIFNVYAWVMAWNGYSSPYPFDNDYKGDMAYFQNTSFQGPEASYRGWTWLTCTEFGWLQTTDNGHGIFGNLIPLSWFLQYCQDMFDQTVTSDFIQNRVAATLQRYGLPSNYNGSNVVLPNGSLDPWSELGCNVSSNATNRFARTTVGGGHCVDMYPYNKGTIGSVEPDDVANTIQLVKDQVAYYLTLPGPFNSTSTSTPMSNSTSKRASSTSVWISLFLIGFFIYLLN